MANGNVLWPQHILYTSLDETVFVIDIPYSIAAAQSQVSSSSSAPSKLLSCKPLEEPYASNEPKTQSARERVRSMERQGQGQNRGKSLAEEENWIQSLTSYVRNALDEVTERIGDRKWCLERVWASDRGGGSRGWERKRKRQHSAGNSFDFSSAQTAQDNDPDDDNEIEDNWVRQKQEANGLLKELAHADRKTLDSISVQVQTATRDSSDLKGSTLDEHPKEQPWPGYFTNPLAMPIGFTFHLAHRTITSTSMANTFAIPPRASFLLGRIPTKLPSLLALFADSGSPPSFDLVLLDPPWPSRSVRRASPYATYRTLESTGTALSAIPVSSLLSRASDVDAAGEKAMYVAMWITNRAAMRELVSGKGGLFEEWGCELAEFWVWVKVTKYGKPVTELGGIWRRPWEVLLIGRKITQPECKKGEIKRRIIFAVPDLHSRKPCLKTLFERILFHEDEKVTGVRVLELFARYAVSGWTSWGDEVLKYNARACYAG